MQGSKLIPSPYSYIVFCAGRRGLFYPRCRVMDFLLVSGGTLFGGRKPLYSEAGVFSLQTTYFPRHRLGCAPRPCVFFSHSAFLGFARVRTASPVCFRASGALPKPRAARFRASGALPLLSRRVFSLWECSQGLPRAFPCFGSVPIASPACFQPLGVLPRLSSCISMLRERSQGFPGVFSAFGSVPKASVAARCAAYGVRPHVHIGIVRAWRGNHTKSFHREDEPWQRQQWQR